MRLRLIIPTASPPVTFAFDEVHSPTKGTWWVHEFYDKWENIPSGTFTFTITDFNNQSVSVDDELVKNDLPVPANCAPASGSTIFTVTPIISWDSVGGASAYRVRIYEGFDTKILESDYQSGTSYTVPEGVLTIGGTYNYRIYAYREDYPVEEVDNTSVNAIYPSERPFFTIAPDIDSDGDNIPDFIEDDSDCLFSDNPDSDGDGLLDGTEDANHNGSQDRW